MLIIDASVVIKWFVEEKDSFRARLLRDKHVNGKTILIAPDLLIYEVANVLVVSKLFSLSEIKKCLQDLYDLEIDLISPTIDIILSATETASNKQITIYDACYLALAKELDIKFVTADEKLFSLTRDLRCTELLSYT